MMRNLSCAMIGAGLLCAPALWSAEELRPSPPAGELTKIDKSRFTLWNPTPREYLREMNALYESPYTVDAGHAQTETYVIDYAYDRDSARRADTRTATWRIAPTTLKLGVLNNLDLEVDIVPYTRVRTADRLAGTVTVNNGFGDVIPKAKLNLWGNDGGSSAFALMPFVKFPTSQDGLGNHAIEGGLVLPISIELPFDWWLGLSPEFDWMQDSDGRGYHFEFANTAYLWHEIVGNLSGYVEFFSWISAERDSRWIGTADLGLTYLVTKNIQLDAGVLFGVTRPADDINLFLGVSFRF